MNQQLFAGIARRDVTPAPGSLLFGYGIVRPGQEVVDSLAATALVLRTHETTLAHISIDWCIVDEEETAALRAAVSTATNIPHRNIIISATHTHSGPTTVTCWGWGVKDQIYLDEARPKIVEAVAAAQESCSPVRVGIGAAETMAGINRREVMPDGSVNFGFNEWGPRDSNVTVVRFEGSEGTVAQIVHLAAHPTSRGHDPAVSRDWPGVMIDRVEEVTGAPVLFLNGASGDVAPRTSVGGAVGDGDAAMREVGLLAAHDALRAWKGIKEFRDIPVQVLYGDISLPLAPLPSRDEALRQQEVFAGHDNAAGELGMGWNYWRAVLAALDMPQQAARVYRQTITRLGPLTIVPFGGEVLAEIGLRIKKFSPFPYTLCAGNSNGSHGYYVTREARGRGGYEVWCGRAYGAYQMADNIDDVLVSENLALLRRFTNDSL